MYRNFYFYFVQWDRNGNASKRKRIKGTMTKHLKPKNLPK